VAGCDALPEEGEEENTGGFEPEDDVELPPPEGADRAFRDALVSEALAKLAKGDQLILHLFYVEELSYTEIARRLGCSDKAVGPRLTRARERFRAVLHPEVEP